MSIFADSFNYRIIKEKGLDKLMPETAAFLKKELCLIIFTAVPNGHFLQLQLIGPVNIHQSI